MTALPLHELAAVVGAVVWSERRLFEVLGAESGREADRAVLYSQLSAHAAWRAEQMMVHLYRFGSTVPNDWVCDDGALEEQIANLESGVDLARVGAALDGLLGRYRTLESQLVEPFDASLQRTVALCCCDLERDLSHLK